MLLPYLMWILGTATPTSHIAPILGDVRCRTAATPSGRQGINWRVLERRDISIATATRMTYRIRLETERPVSNRVLRQIAARIWSDGNTHWDDLTLWFYLCGMEAPGLAFATVELNRQGVVALRTIDVALPAKQEGIGRRFTVRDRTDLSSSSEYWDDDHTVATLAPRTTVVLRQRLTFPELPGVERCSVEMAARTHVTGWVFCSDLVETT